MKDIDTDNILINFKGGASQGIVPRCRGVRGPPTSFREYFPVRYYLNDFELAACFDYDSDPSTRVVSGLPTKGLLGKYGRDVAPEMLSEEPYCPFRTDVWQLGRMFLRSFQVSLNLCFDHRTLLNAVQHLDEPWTPLTKLFSEMALTDSLSRPTMTQALTCIRQFRSIMSSESLASRVPRPPPVSSSDESLPELLTDVQGIDTRDMPETDVSAS